MVLEAGMPKIAGLLLIGAFLLCHSVAEGIPLQGERETDECRVRTENILQSGALSADNSTSFVIMTII